jgi:AI-2 transport protein TqsA
VPDTATQNRPKPALGPVIRWLLGTIAIILVGWALHTMAPVVVPLVFALICILVVAPIDQAIAGRLPASLKWLGRVTVMLVLLIVLMLFTIGLVYCANQLLASLPPAEAMADLVSTKLTGEPGSGAPVFLPDWGLEAVKRSGDAISSWIATTAGTVLGGIAGATGTLIASALLVVFLVVLALAETPVWRGKATRLWGSEASPDIRAALQAAATKLRQWLLVRTGIGVISAAVAVGWLWLFGVDLLLVWAVLTFLLVFIPNIGAVISGTLPTLYALATQDFSTALWVGAGLFAIEQIIGNWIDPRLQGRQISVSPVVIFVSLLLWGWIWGLAGAFLATPVTVVAMVVCVYVPSLRPFALLLSNQSDLADLDARVKS